MGNDIGSTDTTSLRRRLEHRSIPYLATLGISLLGLAAYSESAPFGAHGLSGITAQLAERVPLLFIALPATVAGICVKLAQDARRTQRQLEERNRELAEANDKLERETQQQQLAEQRFQALFLANPYPMVIFDSESLRYVEVNEAAMQQYGYSRDEFLALRVTEVRPPEDIPRLLQILRKRRFGYDTRGVWRHLRKDGSLFLADITVFQFDKDGHELELVLAHDVTQRVQAEQALRESEAALQSLVNNAPFAICRTSLKEDRFLTVNRAACETLGYSQDEMLGLKLSTQLYFEPRDRERIKEILHRGRTLQAFEISAVKKNSQELRIRIWGVVKPNAAGELDLFDVYVQDVTEQSALEQQVRRVQKLEAVARLAGGIAHDFNNILVVIKLSTEIMLQQVTPENSMSKPLLQVLNAADRAAALTSQLLAFGRQQVMQARIINPNSVVTDVSHLLRRIIGEDIRFMTGLNEKLHNTRLDSNQLGQVLLNLAVNARDAMPEGGTLHIETDNVRLDETYAQGHSPVQPGDYVMIAVSDTGCGIDKNVLPHIFDPFFTTKPIGKGTGLGLSIVYGIVKQSGGYIWVYSEPGQGTTFKLYFPIETADAETVVGNEGMPTLKGRTVMVVEDEAVIRVKLRECLVQLGYKVVDVPDAAAALQRFEREKRPADLVLTDLVMPHMSGHELAEELAGRGVTVPVVFMSGYTEHNAVHREILERGSVFLQKPFSVADLSAAVTRALLMSAPFAEARLAATASASS